jgi:peptidyl-prolyl cis-trans isomerase C
MARARARHILVKSKEVCEKLKAEIEKGTDFAKVASENSLCPSGKRGGDLGEFGKGEMVPEFDTVIFTSEIGKVHGPVKTQFGYHLIEIISRTM